MSTSPEQELWLAVIRTAFVDAGVKLRDDDGKGGGREIIKCRGPKRKKSTSARNIAKAEAARWFAENSQDFQLVCRLAGLDPDWVRMLANQKLGLKGMTT